MQENGPQIDARLTREVIPLSLTPRADEADCGVILEFRRLARASLDNRAVPFFQYDVYESMAEAQLMEIAVMLGRTHGAAGVTLIHRHGLIAAGETVMYIAVKAPHMKTATACINDLVDVIQRDAPIWRTAVMSAEAGAAAQA